jgi:Skp family chaperone for outer membrane proteins
MNTKIARVIGAALFLTVVAPTISFAQAQPAPENSRTMKIAIIDFQRVMRESAAAKSIRPQIEKLREGLKAEFKQKEDDLNKKRNELVGLQTILAPDKLEQKKQELRQEVVDANNDMQGRLRLIDRAVKRAQVKVEQAMGQVAGELAQEQGFALVLRRAATILSVRSMDVTDEVLKRLDKKLPSVAVNLESDK